MELVKYMDMDTLVDSRGCEKLVNQLIEYDQRLYKDALTGVYNRRYFEEQIKKKNVKCPGWLSLIWMTSNCATIRSATVREMPHSERW